MNIILIGGGKAVYFLAQQFISKNYRVAIINRDPAEAKWLSEHTQTLVLLGDGSDPAMLEEAGARQAEVVVALTPHDEDNLIACQLAQQLYGAPRTVAVVNDPKNEAIFTKLGISVTFSPIQLIASLIEQKVGYEDVTNLIPAIEGRVNMTQVTLHAEAPAVGKTLEVLNLPLNSLIACIVRDGQVIVPRGASRLQADDRLILVSIPQNLGQALRALLGQSA